MARARDCPAPPLLLWRQCGVLSAQLSATQMLASIALLEPVQFRRAAGWMAHLEPAVLETGGGSMACHSPRCLRRHSSYAAAA